MNEFPSKLPEIGTTIFTIMSALAKKEKAINLSQGFPEFDCDVKLKDFVTKYISEGKNQYAPMQGVEKLREVLANKLSRQYRSNVSPDMITVTAGGTQAIYTAISTVVKKGDEVIIFDPSYDCYAPTVLVNGGIPVHINLSFPDFSIPWEKVRHIITAKTRLIIINTPHNPSGTTLKEDDLKQLSEICKNNDLYIISDEVYEHISFNQISHQSVLNYPEILEKAFIIYSFGKTFHITGWKMGYCVAPIRLMKEFLKIHQFLIFSCNTPVQYALAEYMEDEAVYMGISEMYQQKLEIFRNGVKKSRFKLLNCEGTYFQLLDYSSITDEKDVDFAKRLTKENKIASIPVSVFYKDNTDRKVLRFCFAKNNDTLHKATEILCKI